MTDLEGGVAVVTGAASGIGAGLARALAAEGMRLALADIEEAPLAAVAKELRDAGAQAIAVGTDVSQRKSVEALAERVFSELGGAHVVCNNAGVCQGGPLLEMSDADWDWLLGVNFHGVRLGCSVFAPRMREQREPGHILNTASVGGFLAGGGLGMYTTTKFAVVAYSEALAAELAPSGITVSVLCPSLTRTNLMDAARNRPSDLGPAEAGLGFLTPGVEQGTDADEVGRIALRGIREGAMWIFSDGAFAEPVEARFAGVSAALKRAEEPV